jgi:DivIVA domain-containing protein
MESTFSLVGSVGIGYNVDEVDRFFTHAKNAWTSSGETLTEKEVRFVRFSTNKNGYRTHEVDEALHRLERALAKRNKDAAISQIGEDKWIDEINNQISSFYKILSQSRKNRFPHAESGTEGYRLGEVDRFLNQLNAQFFEGKRKVDAITIKSKLFSTATGPTAYSTYEVDLFLDKVVTILNALEV